MLSEAIDPRELNLLEQTVYTAAFGHSVAVGHSGDFAREAAEKAVRELRAQMASYQGEQ